MRVLVVDSDRDEQLESNALRVAGNILTLWQQAAMPIPGPAKVEVAASI